MLPHAGYLSVCHDLSFCPCAHIYGFHAYFLRAGNRPVYACVLLLAAHHLVGLYCNFRVEPRLTTAHVKHVVVENQVVNEKVVTVDNIAAAVAVLLQVCVKRLYFLPIVVVKVKDSCGWFGVTHGVSVRNSRSCIHEHPRECENKKYKYEEKR